MEEVTWSYCNSDGTILHNGKLVAEYTVPGYVLLRKMGRSWRVERPLGSGTDVVTVTCDDNGRVVCASERMHNDLVGAYLKGKLSCTMRLNVPRAIGSLVGDLIQVPDGEAQDDVSLSLEPVPILTHYTLSGSGMIGYGGIYVKLREYRTVRVEDIQYVTPKGDIVTYFVGEKSVEVSGVYDGTAIVLPGTEIEVQLFDMKIGTPYALSVPEGVLRSGLKALYFPYGPCGEEFFEKMEQRPVPSNLEVNLKATHIAVEKEVFKHLNRGVPEEYSDLVAEVLSNASSMYKQSEQPMLSALKWALAERRGKL